MRTEEQVRGIVAALEAEYPGAQCSLDYGKDYELRLSVEDLDAIAAYQAKKGESFYFIANKPHMLENRGTREAKAIWISAPPSF